MTFTQSSTRLAALTIGAVAIVAVAFSAALAAPAHAASICPGTTWSVNLKTGATGPNVMALQQFLNMSADTQVAATGAGSPGGETSYFGGLTKVAVNKFQLKYAAQILTPNGLTTPTGNFYTSSRAQANAVCAGSTGTTGGTTGGTTTSGTVTVSLSSVQPSRTLIAGQSAAELGNLTFNGNGSVKQLKLQRTGISTDTTLDNVYLYDGNVRVSDSASIVNGVITFNSGSNGLFTVNGTKTLSVRGDVSATAASGNTIGFSVWSTTNVGGSEVLMSNMSGPLQSISTLSNPATVNITSPATPSAQTINAGTSGYTIYSLPVNVGTRSVNLKAITFRYTGSASTDALANVQLVIDGTVVSSAPVWSNTTGTSRVGFDLTSAPKSLTTGSHTIELRADVVGGSFRNFTIAIENRGDIVVEDSQVAGFNVGVTYASGAFSTTNATAGTITVNQGTLTVTQDPAFGSVTKIVGGATNVKIASFKFQAYGEDVKVESIQVTPTLSGMTPASNGIRNLTLYANGGAIGSSVSIASTSASTFNLGSSLIIPAGTSVIVSVAADIMDASNVTYTAGTIGANITLPANSYKGTTSSQYNDTLHVVSVTGSTKTISSANITFGVTSGFTAQTVSPNNANVKIGSFTLQAGSAEGVTVTNVAIALGGNASTTNFSNLRITDGLNPVGQPTASNNFSVNFAIPANGSKTIDVYADASSQIASTSVTATISYRGATSNVNNTAGPTTGPAISFGAGTLGATTHENSSPVSQYIVGGTTGLNLSNFKFLATGSDIVIKRIKFAASSTNSVAGIVVGGVTKSLVNGIADVDGLNIAVPVGGAGVVVPVSVNLAGVTSQSANSNTNVRLAVTEVEYTSGSATTITAVSPNIAGNSFTLVGTKPTVTVNTTTQTGLALASETKIGEATVAADAAGDVRVTQITFTSAFSGFNANPTSVSPVFIAAGSNGSVAINGSTCTTNVTGSAASTTCSITGGYTIAKGTSQTFSLRGTLNGATLTSGVKAQVSTTATPSSGFVWDDLVGNVTGLTGALIYGYPTGSYTTTQ